MTGVQTCALPIFVTLRAAFPGGLGGEVLDHDIQILPLHLVGAGLHVGQVMIRQPLQGRLQGGMIGGI